MRRSADGNDARRRRGAALAAEQQHRAVAIRAELDGRPRSVLPGCRPVIDFERGIAGVPLSGQRQGLVVVGRHRSYQSIVGSPGSTVFSKGVLDVMNARTFLVAARATALALLLAISGAAPSSSASPLAAQGQPGQMLIIVINHIDPTRPFPTTVGTGIKTAEKDFAAYNVKTEFVGPPAFDVVAEGQLLDAAIARAVAGHCGDAARPRRHGTPHQAACDAAFSRHVQQWHRGLQENVLARARGQDEYPPDSPPGSG